MWGYRRAVISLKQYDKPLYDVDELKDLPGIGKGILDKLKEFAAEGHIARFDNLDTDEKLKVLTMF